MDVLLWIVLLSGLLMLGGIALLLKYDSKWDRKSQARARIGWCLFVPFGIAFVISGFIAVVVYPARSVGRTTCRNFAAQSGYQTKFVILNWSDTGTCLARTPDGHWTKNTNIIVNVPSKGP